MIAPCPEQPGVDGAGVNRGATSMCIGVESFHLKIGGTTARKARLGAVRFCLVSVNEAEKGRLGW